MKKNSKRLPADERRAVTVETVIELAAEHNPNDITTTAIAERMGLTQGALFRHFPTKDAILEAVLGWVAEQLLSRIDKVISKIDSPTEALELMFMTHIDFISEHPGIPRMFLGELQRPDNTLSKKIVQVLIRQYSERLYRLFEAGKTAGELDNDLDIEAASALFIGTVQGLVVQSLLAGDVKQIRHDAPRVFSLYRLAIGRKG